MSGRGKQLTAVELAEKLGRLYDACFEQPNDMTREEFVTEMMGVMGGKKFRTDLIDIVLDEQISRSQAGIAAHKRKVS